MSTNLPGAPPRVLHICDQYFLLTQNWIQTQIGFLERYAPFVLTGRTENLDDAPGTVAPYHVSGSQRSLMERILDPLSYRLNGYLYSDYRQARAHSPDVVHAHFGFKGYGALPLAQALRSPLITTFYGYDLSALLQKEPKWHDRYHQLFERGAHFLTEGPYMRQRLIDLGCPPEKVTVQHLGIPIEQYEFAPERLEWSAASNEPLSVLMVGRFTEKKGMVYGLRAVADLRERGGRIRLTIVGDANDEDPQQVAYKKRILKIIDENDLADTVDLRGFVPLADLPGIYRDHHVLLAPSVVAADGDSEGGAPVALIEASATGLPVVGSSHCDIPEVVDDGVTGLLSPERNASALADNLWKIYTTPGLLRELGSAARSRMEQEYDAHAQARRLESIYTRVASS